MGTSAVAGVSYLILLQLFSRIVTFALNTALARGLGPQWYAVANVQLQLVSATALFLSREGLRRACQRIYTGGTGPTLTYGVNLAWLSVPVTAIVALMAGVYFADSAHSGGAHELVGEDDYAWAVWAMCGAAVIETCAEPAWLYAQSNMHLPERIIAEGAALGVRAAATAWLALHLRQGARAFGTAQLLYACAYGGLLLALLWRRCSLRLLLPRAHAGRLSPPPAERALAAQMCWQAAQKYVLTEGERLVLMGIAPLEQQGAFALVSNLGSLVARLLLQPLEEMAYAHFSRAASTSASAAATRNDGDAAAAAAADDDDDVPPPLDAAAARTVHALLRGAAIFGGVFLCFGPAYSWLLLHLLYGAKWSSTDAPALLAYYCMHVCAMALNGLSEAFVHATATRPQLGALNRVMVVFSAVYVALALGGMLYGGSRGLIVANTTNMAMRTAYSLRFIRRAAAAAAASSATAASSTAAGRATAAATTRLLPHPLVVGSLIGSALLTNAAGLVLGTPSSPPAHHALHVLLGGGCLLGVGVCVLRGEREIIAGVRALRRGGDRSE